MSDKRLTEMQGPPTEPGLYLFLNVSPDAVVVHYARRIARASRHALRAPLVVVATEGSDPISELILQVIDADGTIRESFGWPADLEVFVDTIDPKTGDLMAGPSQIDSEWGARFRIPAADSTRYLRFFRQDSGRAIQPLGLFDLHPGQPFIPLPFPVPWPHPPTPLPLPPLEPVFEPIGPGSGPPRDPPRRDYRIAGGYIEGTRRLVDSGDPRRCFDIVILGDGFQALGSGTNDLGVFDRYANLMAQAFMRTPPYSYFMDRINIHAVYVVSNESGITDCPEAGGTKDTYFKSRGFFNNTPEKPTAATYIGIADCDRPRVAEAVRAAIPDQYADLIMMIVNCAAEGGSSPPGMGMAFVTLAADTVKFAKIAMHESGHVVGNLCEEYNPCNRRDQNRQYPNEATAEEVMSNTVPWKRLADATTELDGAGHFKAIHHYNDLVDAECQPVMAAGLYTMLGAFWGCHNGHAPNDGNGTARYCHECGSGFYRPMAECMMRRLRYPFFCRVCERLITDRILASLP